jgi:lysozyme family protein
MEAVSERYADSLAFVLAREGGWSDHPSDPGGATNRGITQTRFSAWLRDAGKPDRSVRTIRPAELEAIYREEWDGARCNDVPEPADLALFDAVVNSGRVWGVRFLQRALGVVDDGIFGPKTLAAVELWSADGPALGARLTAERMRYCVRAMRRHAKLRDFADGWTLRWASVLDEVTR